MGKFGVLLLQKAFLWFFSSGKWQHGSSITFFVLIHLVRQDVKMMYKQDDRIICHFSKAMENKQKDIAIKVYII